MISLRRTVSYVTGATLPASRVYCDNQSAIAQLRKRDLSARSRPNYVRHRRAISASVIEKATTGNLLPEDTTKVEIAAFLEPPGGF